MQVYILSVPVEQHDGYIANGWTLKSMDKQNPGHVIVTKSIAALRPEDRGKVEHIVSLKQPSLLQRATILRPLRPHRTSRVFDSVNIEHMGDQRFTLGLTSSLARMNHTRFAYATFKAENLVVRPAGRTYALRIYTRLRGDDLARYVHYLLDVRNGTLKVARPSGFELKDFGAESLPTGSDFWWDVENDVIFSFDKNYMFTLKDRLEASFAIMDGANSTGSIRLAE